MSAGTVRRLVPAAVSLLLMCACQPTEEELVPLDCEGVAEVTTATVFSEVQAGWCVACHFGGGQFPDQGSGTALGALIDADSSYGSLKLVARGDPAASVLYLKASGGTPAGFRGPGGENVGGPMPPNRTLPAESRELLRGWICGTAAR